MLDIDYNCEPTAAAEMKHIRDGFLLMFGGLPSNSVEMTWGDRTRIFDFNNRIWTELDLEIHPIGRLHFGMTLIDTNTVMIYGGLIKGAKSLAHKTETWIFHLDSVPTSVEDNAISDNNITLSPNPASDYIEISNVILNEVKIRENGESHPVVLVFDLLGIKYMDSRLRGNDILVSDEGKVRIDISSLSPGVYFVKVSELVSRFIKL